MGEEGGREEEEEGEEEEEEENGKIANYIKSRIIQIQISNSIQRSLNENCALYKISLLLQ